MKNLYSTEETIVSIDGKIVKLEILFEGAAKYFRKCERLGYLSADEADELFQEAVLKILKSIHGYDTRKVSSPMAYGYTVAKNCHIDRWKAGGRFGEPFSSFGREDDEGDAYCPSFLESFRADESEADSEILCEEIDTTIQEFVSALNREDKVTVQMSLYGAQPEAIATELGCTSNAAAIRLCKLRKRLDDFLRMNGFDGLSYRKAI